MLFSLACHCLPRSLADGAVAKEQWDIQAGTSDTTREGLGVGAPPVARPALRILSCPGDWESQQKLGAPGPRLAVA